MQCKLKKPVHKTENSLSKKRSNKRENNKITYNSVFQVMICYFN